MKKKLIVSLLAFSLLLFAVGCKSGEENAEEAGEEKQSASVVLQVKSRAGAYQQSMLRNAIGSVDEIQVITIDVKEGSSYLVTGMELSNSGSGWNGIADNLPMNKTLQFVAHAYNSVQKDTKIYTGSTNQLFAANGQVVTINLDPIQSSAPTRFAKLTNVTYSSDHIVKNSNINVTTTITGNANEAVSYNMTAGSGVFADTSGDLTLNGAGTMDKVFSYQAPTTAGSYIHSLKVTNAQNNWTETDFKMTVHDQPLAGNANVSVKFAPAIIGLGVKRTLGYDADLQWTAKVSDDQSSDLLTWNWSIDDTTDTTFFSDPKANPTVLKNYDAMECRQNPGSKCNLRLTVTDQDGLSSTIHYILSRDDF